MTPTSRALARAVLRLTTGSDLNTEPAISPDGEWVAYASDRSGEGHLDIWIQRLSGGEAVRLTRDPADDREPTFSADGSRIAFRSERDGGGIYVIPAYSGGDARVARPRWRTRTAVLARRSLAGVFDGTGPVRHRQNLGLLLPDLPGPVIWRRVDAIAAGLRVGHRGPSGRPTASKSLLTARRG